MSAICPKCDGYGVVPVNGIAVKCDEPGCRGYRTHAQALADIGYVRPVNQSDQPDTSAD